MMHSGYQFSSTDRTDLESRGIDLKEALRQLDLLDGRANSAKLLRACRPPGDGVRLLDPDRQQRLEETWEREASRLRVMKFVPASGAATRMFSFLSKAEQDADGGERAQLEEAAARGSAAARQALQLAAQFGRLPFADEIVKLATERGIEPSRLEQHPLALGEIIAGPAGLALAALPKALIPFHAYGTKQRSAFEEHLYEAAQYCRGRNGVSVHFTVTPEHLEQFEQAARRARSRARESTGADFEIEFSVQDPSTDTLAILESTAGGLELLRSETGRLLFRPSGHGALITNLGRLDADVVFVKNIDNVAPQRRHRISAAWKKRLGGLLLRLRKQGFELLDRLEALDDCASSAGSAALRDALWFCRENLALRLPASAQGIPPETVRSFLIDRLDRPLRVCGVVRNVGEPGGGPFWVQHESGELGFTLRESGQIVESNQVDSTSPSQRAIFLGASHFNPVDLVCAPRDRRGHRYELTRFVDPNTSFVARKEHAGRSIRVLERPGLWNGAMAGWNTAFVEVPLETFTPVKTILDLTRGDHQARPDSAA